MDSCPDFMMSPWAVLSEKRTDEKKRKKHKKKNSVPISQEYTSPSLYKPSLNIVYGNN